ncbi:13331_t:CDS:2 [Funneliformis mosseae]|uniref:13331_t:CDS:1 n=1 Tax=Funneliformis mosseae TaxID=27381 RepID=A0A9N9CKP4_FUNMO|nr:13331_t:CDS:2 [Funneliformis mosseae]
MELHKNFVKEERNIKVSVQNLSKAISKDWTEETVIFTKTEQGSMMDRSKNRYSEKINESQETNKIPIQTSKSTVNLNNTLGGKSYVLSYSINNLLESNRYEWESVGDIDTLGLQQLCRNQLMVLPVTVEARPFNKDANNLYGFTRNNAIMH